jgi:hypothetical protein
MSRKAWRFGKRFVFFIQGALAIVRSSRLVVAGVLSATRPEESLKFEKLYQAIVDGKSGKACAKIYPGNCGDHGLVMDLGGVGRDPHVSSSPSAGQEGDDGVSGVKVTPVVVRSSSGDGEVKDEL